MTVTNSVHICEVLGAARGELISDKVIGRDVAGREFTVDHHWNAVCVDGVEVDAINALDDLKTNGRHAEAPDGLSISEVRDGEVL
ncbi:hypothetical protein GOB94_02175 [Granulicella sp. 5B5]|uniref:hypothetical protein n=1 Tax=Granulicella sp. 5B5 TaxID=1617967 RepID=UPI0015F6BB97|nr:hypothetical protein [Granulicella sp. 5B5]QMV17642.1 hypothetical protein GOB94_02175 [Granulicella sp. 5B5]